MKAFGILFIPVILLMNACKPEGFDAQAWQPAENPGLLRILPPNQDLAKAEVITADQWNGPEDIAVDRQGRVYAGSVSGAIQRLNGEGKVEAFAQLPGQVLGLDFDENSNLYACVDQSGLWRIDPNGKAELIADGHEGRKFGLLDDVKVGADGMVYFSEATSKYVMATHILDFLEGVETGALFRYDPLRKATERLLDHLGFANGVAVAPDASYVLVNETSRYRIRKYVLSGPDAGKDSIFLDNLPGFPDGLSRFADGRFWLAFISIRSPLLDTISPRPFFKNLLAALPQDFLPKEKPYGLIAAFTAQGQWMRSLHDPEGKTVPGITSLEATPDGRLWLGSLHGKALYRVKAD